MRIRLPKHYTVLITRTGQTPLSITIQPVPVLIAALVCLGMPLAWMAALLQHNVRLSERNESLTQTANEVMSDLESLGAEIEDLRQRAGMETGEESSSLPAASPQSSQGGVAGSVPPEQLFEIAKAKVPQLTARLERQVRPALEETLAAEAAREAAFPDGKPLYGKLDVSSEFGLRRNPFGGRGYEIHNGIDFRGPIGLAVYATAEGVVVRAEHSGGFGKHVVIDHGYGYETLYAHLSEVDVQVGDRVQRGQRLGALGNTGRSSGPHLHYTIYRDGQAVNPRYYIRYLRENPAS